MSRNLQQVARVDGRPCRMVSIGHFVIRALKKGAKTALPAAVISLLINAFVVQAMVVHGPSMKPNLDYSHRVLVDKVSYRVSHVPRRGDVVVVDLPQEPTLLVKRAVALPGETVAVRGGQVFVDGEPLEEAWATRQGGPNSPPTRVPAGHVFVLGDNRAASRDSRWFGPVPLSAIDGRVGWIVWPLQEMGRMP
jgi:signal peptidase I